MSFIEKIPTTNAVKNESMSAQIGIFGRPCLLSSKNSITSEAKMIGMLIRNENFEADSLSAPDITPALIVVPERDIPGKTAKPCAMPIMEAIFVFNVRL